MSPYLKNDYLLQDVLKLYSLYPWHWQLVGTLSLGFIGQKLYSGNYPSDWNVLNCFMFNTCVKTVY